MLKQKSLDDLATEINEHGGVMTVSAEVLRNRYGAERLGVNVRTGISKELAGLGVGHYPRFLPERHDPVRVYKLGSPIADVINAVLTVDSKSDAQLRKLAKGDCEKILARIRELLDDED